MPSTTVTNTTGETGRKVPVPRRWTSNAGNSAAASARCASISASSSSVTSVGGTRVMWVGMVAAIASPTLVR